MKTPPVFELRLHGGGVEPETTELAELITLLQGVERTVKAVVLAKRPADRDFLVSLLDIGRGSNVLSFGSSQPALAREAWEAVGSAIREDGAFRLPRLARKLLADVQAFAKRRAAVVEFALPASENPIAAVGPDTSLTLVNPGAAGETVLYGWVTRVGGKEPKVGLSLDDGSFVPCEATLEIAKELGRRLYERVGVHGFAEWEAENLVVASFKIDKITEYEETPIGKAVADLAEASGEDAWTDIDDVVAFLADWRGKD